MRHTRIPTPETQEKMDLGKGVLLLLALVQIVAAKVEEDTFINIKNYNGEQVVLFYRSSGGYKKTMRIFKKAAKVRCRPGAYPSPHLLIVCGCVLQKVGKKLPGVKWRTCDGDKAANKKVTGSTAWTAEEFDWRLFPLWTGV